MQAWKEEEQLFISASHVEGEESEPPIHSHDVNTEMFPHNPLKCFCRLWLQAEATVIGLDEPSGELQPQYPRHKLAQQEEVEVILIGNTESPICSFEGSHCGGGSLRPRVMTNSLSGGKQSGSVSDGQDDKQKLCERHGQTEGGEGAGRCLWKVQTRKEVEEEK